MSAVRTLSKAAVLPFGLPARRSADDVVILLYHRVGDGTAEIELSAAALNRQLAFVARQAITLDQALAGRGGVVVTFDDGYAATSTKWCCRCWRGTRSRRSSTSRPAWSAIRRSRGIRSPECAESGLVTVGSHTHTHANLAEAPEGAAEEEMRRSKELIEDRLGVPCRALRVPVGVGGPAADRVARRLFVTAAWTRGGRTARVTSIRTGWDGCRCWARRRLLLPPEGGRTVWTPKPGSIGRSAVGRGGRVDGPDRARRHRGPHAPVPAAAAAASRFATRAIDVTAISAPGPWVPEIESRGIRHIPWTSATRAWDPGADVRAFVELLAILRRERFDARPHAQPEAGRDGTPRGARPVRTPVVLNTVHGL